MSRRLDLALFRGDDSDADDDLLVKSTVELDEIKSKTFTHGVTKKTKRDLELENAKQKKAEEELATQRALEEFSREFAQASGPSGQRGGRGRGRASFVRAGESVPARSSDVWVEPEQRTSAEHQNVQLDRSPSPQPPPRSRGKRAMDAFLEEIKSNQEARDSRSLKLPKSTISVHAPSGPSSYRTQEALTTNLCVARAEVTEDRLGHLFAMVGPVGSVKIMWPRSSDTIDRHPRLTGFVCFLDRSHAEAAVKQFDGYPLDGSVLRVSWSKPVGIPKVAAFEHRTSEYQGRPHRPGPANGASTRAPLKPFEDNGYSSVYSSDSEELSDQKRSGKGQLGRMSHRRFEAMLRGMSGKRVEIARAMEFAVKRADASDEISDVVAQSLCLIDTPVPRKMARLHLVSDILHNSASPLPNVWRYRQALEKRLPAIFGHFSDVHDKLAAHSGDVAAAVFKRQVEAVLDIWEHWMLFTADVHVNLRNLLNGHTGEEPQDNLANDGRPIELDRPVKSAGFKSSFKPVSATSEAASRTAGPQANNIPPAIAGGLIPDDDLDGAPLDVDVDVDGEPIEEGNGVTGLPHVVLAGEDVDGEPLSVEVDDDDLDGEMM